mmetsp:Transcript_78994/g.209764  ORF Transcript_78994/g.209764 Transcript_78994/m.209764 type:complete len:321 (-) Transcript_78994:131-1093(-)
MAGLSEFAVEVQLPAEELPFLAGGPGPAAPGSPVPSTPPRRNRQSCLMRVESSEKLPSPRRLLRRPESLEGSRSPSRGLPLPLLLAVPPLPATGGSGSSSGAASSSLPLAAFSAAPAEEAMVDIQQMRSRVEGDDKYWAQIKFAYQLLAESTSTELRLAEVAASHRSELEPLFRDAIAGQEADRLSAVAMLRVLRQLVAETDAEVARRRALARLARPCPTRSEHEVPTREPDEDIAAKKAKCGEAVPAAVGAAVGEPAPSTPPRAGAAGSSMDSTPARTPVRRKSASCLAEWTPPAVQRQSKVKLSLAPVEGLKPLYEDA